jgi:hypothetical protein
LTLERSERVALVDFDDPEMSVLVQAKMLSLNRSGLYYKPVPPSEEEIKIKHAIDEIYTNAYSGAIWTLKPGLTGHWFRKHLDTRTGFNWTPIPVFTGHHSGISWT